MRAGRVGRITGDRVADETGRARFPKLSTGQPPVDRKLWCSTVPGVTDFVYNLEAGRLRRPDHRALERLAALILQPQHAETWYCPHHPV